MRFVFVAAALFASAGVACSLLLDDDGFTGAPDTLPDGAPRDDSSAGDGGSDAPVVVDPGADIGNGSGRNGPLVVANETSVNTYAPLSADAPAGATTIETDVAPGWIADDVVMLWETTGLPAITSGATTNVDLGSGNVGRYELGRITKAEPKGTGAVFTLAKPLVSPFRVGAAQIIRVPEHTDITIAVSGALRPLAWDGRVGGIVAILATGKIQIDGAIDVEGRGFRGGLPYRNTTFSDCPALDGVPAQGYAAKGEGLSPSGYSTPPDAGAARGGFGSVANGGGGGNCHNAGGGGGGNGGAGGKGGRAWTSSSYADVGGFGGGAVTTSIVDHVVLGGGGGAGDSEDSPGEITTGGAAGGGVVFARAATVIATGTVSAKGASAATGDKNGGGGGGAGGTISIRATQRITCGVAMIASGGNGSSTVNKGTGPGGGGGGGQVLLAAPTIECTPSVAAGTSGTGNDVDGGAYAPNHGAKDGLAGKVVTAP